MYDLEDSSKKQFVGRVYFNFAKAEERPKVLRYIGKCLADIIEETIGNVDVVIAAPMGGIKLSGAVADALGCRGVFAEKKIIALANPGEGLREQSELVIKRHGINQGDRIVIVEDVCNNFSTTEKLVNVIERKGGIVVGIACFLNRSSDARWKGLPVANLLHIPTQQWKQEDPDVAGDIASDNIVWEVKKDWIKLEEAMNNV